MVGAALIVLTLVIVSGLLKNLPDPTLAAVVIAASLCLADLLGRLRLWRQRNVEFLLSITAFLVTKCGGADCRSGCYAASACRATSEDAAVACDRGSRARLEAGALARRAGSGKARCHPYWVTPAGVWTLNLGEPDPKQPSAPWSQESDN